MAHRVRKEPGGKRNLEQYQFGTAETDRSSVQLLMRSRHGHHDRSLSEGADLSEGRHARPRDHNIRHGQCVGHVLGHELDLMVAGIGRARYLLPTSRQMNDLTKSD